MTALKLMNEPGISYDARIVTSYGAFELLLTNHDLCLDDHISYASGYELSEKSKVTKSITLF